MTSKFYFGGIHFPQSVRPTPCKTYTRSRLQETPHGAVKIESRISMSLSYYLSIDTHNARMSEPGIKDYI